jgi:zinc and cadmium transporter
MIGLLVAAVLVMITSLVGVITLWSRARRFVERNLGFLVSFSAGVFLVMTYRLIGEVVEHSTSVMQGFGWILFGMVAIWLLFKLLPALHHHDTHHGDHVEHHHIDPRRLLISDGIHNLGDGILLAASFLTAPVLGAAVAISICVHETLQQLSEFFVLRDAGYSVGKALRTSFLVQSTLLVGALGGYYLLDIFSILEVPLLGIAAGAFLVVVLNDLIPHSVREAKSTAHYVRHLAWFVIGLALMSFLAWALPHPEKAPGDLTLRLASPEAPL